jgi:hypothetical protein
MRSLILQPADTRSANTLRVSGRAAALAATRRAPRGSLREQRRQPSRSYDLFSRRRRGH